ncbi:glycosyl hydrolase [Cellvibrio sp. UBA7661]|uniref:glycosyl hydrolase n=1 Tax=Cellvibrio sp. UBA7661 TaxID=1946311 RepID=UPI002F359887
MQSYRRLIGSVLPGLVLPGLLTVSFSVQAGEVAAGAGSYTTEKPAHRWAPSTAEGYDQTVPEGQPWGIYVPRQEIGPKVSARFQNSGKPTPTHEFWSSVIWPHAVKNLIRNENGGVIETNVDAVPYSHWMSNSPYTLKFTNTGINLTYAQIPLLVPYRYEDPTSDKRVLPSTSNPKFTAYTYPARIDPRLDPLGGTELNIRFDGLDADETLLDDYSDFAATVLLKNPGANESTQSARVTLVNGSPFIHFQKTGLSTVSFTYFNGMRIIHESNGALALYLGDVRAGYAIFAPQGTQFSYNLANLDLKELASNGKITMTLPAGHQHFSVAILPNEINAIFKAPISYTEQGFAIAAGTAVSNLPTHIAGTRQPLVVSRLVGDFFREDEPGDGVGVEELDALVTDYRRHAFALPTDTHFEYQYDEAQSEVTSDYEVTTQLPTAMAGDTGVTNQTMMGLYRHQYINTSGLDFAYTYSTPRGEMKVIKGNSFTTHIHHPGLLPNLPNTLEGAELERLMTLLDQDKNGQFGADGLTRNDVLDTYNNGKELNWMLQLLHIAEQTNRADVAATLMGRIKAHLEDWLSADDWQQDLAYINSQCNPMAEPMRSNCYRDLRLANEKKYFYYNEQWNSLTGYPASFGSDTELNDHHFHAGYLISAAAAVARYDHSWAQQWKPMVDLLIKDSANWDRNDTRFQYLRYFDIYNGYSLANGHLNMDAGGNQESSSESINFAQAVALWGSETGDSAIRDLGIFLYASEIQAIQQYWFDVDNQVFPRNVFWDNGSQFVQKDFDRASVGLVWHSKADYGTWFSAAPRMIAGINFLPITGASLHLGHMDRKLANGSSIPSLQLIVNRLDEDTNFFATQLWHRDLPAEYIQYDFRRKTKFWDDLMWQAEALVNPQAAVQKFNAAGNYKTEFDSSLAPMYPNDEVRSEAGASKTHTYHWIFNLRQLGRPVKNISANTAHYAVFDKNGTRTYVAYNPTATPKTVTFSDGVSISVAPFSMSGDDVVAPAVTNLTVGQVTTTSATASWSALSGEWTGASYRVVVTDSSNATVFDQTVSGTSAAISGLVHNTDYTLRVISLFDGLSGRAAFSSFTTELDLSQVPRVENLAASNLTHESAKISWNAIPSVYLNADYAIELRTQGVLVQTIPSTGGITERTLTGLSAATNYTVSLVARSNGVLSPAATLSFVTKETPPACDATAPYCVETTSCNAVRITLNRNAVWADILLTSPLQSGGYRMPKTADGKSYFDVAGLNNGSQVSFRFTYFDTVGHDLGPYQYTHSTANCGTSSSAPSSSSSSVPSTSSSVPSTSSSVPSTSSSVPSSSSVANEIGVVKMAPLANGGMQFSVRLSERKQQVHFFARRNGLQDYVINDVQVQPGGEVNNGDGTYTYQVTRSGAYTAGNLVEARFYTFTPATGQSFYPGPVENSLTSMTYLGGSSASSQSSSSAPSSVSSSSTPSSVSSSSVSSSSSSSSVAGNGYTATAVMPNGANVAYTTTAQYSNGGVKITFTTQENLNWAWVFTPGWNNMTRVQGNSFEVTIPNVAPGTAISYYFTVSTASRGEANNNNQPHSWVVQ